MDLATLIGLVSGTAVVLVAIFMGGDFMTFVNVPSLLLVIGGAIAATILRFTMADVITPLKTGIAAAMSQSRTGPRVLIQEIARPAQPPDQHHAVAQRARRQSASGPSGSRLKPGRRPGRDELPLRPRRPAP